jgi:hypothetical protein
MSEAADFN